MAQFFYIKAKFFQFFLSKNFKKMVKRVAQDLEDMPPPPHYAFTPTQMSMMLDFIYTNEQGSYQDALDHLTDYEDFIEREMRRWREMRRVRHMETPIPTLFERRQTGRMSTGGRGVTVIDDTSSSYDDPSIDPLEYLQAVELAEAQNAYSPTPYRAPETVNLADLERIRRGPPPSPTFLTDDLEEADLKDPFSDF